MKTEDLKEERQEEIIRLDDNIQYNISREVLKQFKEVKRVLNNVSFNDKGKKVIIPEILIDIFDELRKERKIFMVLQDAVGVD